MDKQFDELSKSLAEEGVSRRQALRKIGFSLAGVLLACLGIGGSKSASAQGAYTCCSYQCGHCYGDEKGTLNSHYHVCVEGTVCPPPNCGSCASEKLIGSQSVNDCAKCK